MRCSRKESANRGKRAQADHTSTLQIHLSRSRNVDGNEMKHSAPSHREGQE
jgi:hypothetical protein